MDPLTVKQLTSKADERLVEEEMAKFEQEMLNLKSHPIHEFAKSGNLTGVKRQVTSGVKPNVADGDGRQAIHLAAINGHVGIVKYLHEQGVSLTVQDHSGRQPLHAATVGAKQKVVRWLIEQHVPVDARDKKGRNVFHLAALGGSHKLLRWLLTFITTTVSTEAGRAMHLCDKDNNTALHFAAQRGHVPAIEYLVEEGLRVDDQNIFGQTPAMVARLHNRSQALAWLGETEDLILQLRNSKKKERTLVKQVESCEEELSKAVDEFESQKREWQQQRDQFRRMILELQQDLEMCVREPKRLKKKIQELGCASEALIRSHERETREMRKRIKVYRGY